MCGRVTMEAFADHSREQADIERFALDPSGRLAWASNNIDGDHVVAILSEHVSDDYLSFLRERGVSYLLAGPQDVNLQLALEKIRSRFGVKTLLLESGGGINGSLLQAGLIDELSLLIAPVTDGRTGTAALFDIEPDSAKPRSLNLNSVERLQDGCIWLRYHIAGQDIRSPEEKT
jgi:2,5-diamino-6-(ribosylamino)-4(3H)-pyrimidinone 5'-phosphate reductase